MLCIFKANTVTNKYHPSAGETQAIIESKITPAEHSPTVQHRKEGKFKLSLKTIKSWQGKELTPQAEQALNRNPDLALLLGQPEEIITVTDEKKESGQVILSPSLNPLTLADFPDGFAFGNGVTCNVKVQMKDGTEHLLSWAIFPEDEAPTVIDSYQKLRAIFED